MKNNKSARKHSNSLTKQLLSEITPVEKLQTQVKMTLAARMDDLLIVRGWGKSEFADKVNKNPSEITKWLSGTHNFTVDTLAEIAAALNMQVAELFAPRQTDIISQMRMVIAAREMPQSIKYITPITAIPLTTYRKPV